MSINVIDLMNLLKAQPNGLVVRLVTRNVPEMKNANGCVTARAYTFKEDIYSVLNVSDYGDGEMYVSFLLSTGAQDWAYVPNDFQFVVLNDEEKKELEATFEKRQMENLHSHLVHSGSVGAWAEFFVVNDKNEVIPGDLISKRSTGPGNRYGTISASGNASSVEFQTTFNSCLAGTIDSMACGLKSAYDQAREKFPTAKISTQSVKKLPLEALKALDETSLSLKKFDVKNAYGFKRNAEVDIPMRACQTAFQFQLNGMIGLSDDRAKSITKTIDATLGVACVSLLAKYNQLDRVKLGGLPGDYRTTPNQLEYYGLGNTWMMHPMCANLVFDFARKCAVFGEKGFGKHWIASEDEVVSCMMELNVDLAREIMGRNKDIMIKMFKAAWPICRGDSATGVPNLSNDIKPEKAQEFVWEVFNNGIESVLGDISENMTSNWTMDGKWIRHSEGDDKNVWRTINARHGARKFTNQIIYG
jgi:hypothetical protein